MNISVFGMGYVGCITAACLASAGHSVVGVDIKENKIDVLRSGKAPIYEKGLDKKVESCINNGALSVTTSSEEAIEATDISLISVGTPQGDNGKADLTFLNRVITDIGTRIGKKKYHIIIIRSTIFPQTTEKIIIPLIERVSGKTYLKDFDVIYNPEFLREGSGIEDYYHPPYTLLGGALEENLDLIRSMYAGIEGEIIHTKIEIAEMIKFVNNSFHALKVSFANEVGSICREIGMDSHELMEIFCKDDKLNLSSYYLKPGFAFGGSCLPKDLAELASKAHSLDVTVPILDSIKVSNDIHIERGLEMIESYGKKRIGFLGLAFKSDTDDLRNSPIKSLVDMLVDRQYEVKIFDENIYASHFSRISNDLIERGSYDISALIVEGIDELISSSEIIIIGKNDPKYVDFIGRCHEKQTIIDLVRVSKEIPDIKAEYIGIGW